MTRVPTIMVTYAELHKLRVVISSYRNGRHKQKCKIGFVVAVMCLCKKKKRIAFGLKQTLSPPSFYKIHKFIIHNNPLGAIGLHTSKNLSAQSC